MTTLIDEADGDILERFLDGELSDVETDAVTRRIAEEPALAAALEQARSLRDLRANFFQSLEPGDAEARALVTRARTAARRIDRSAEGFDPAWRWIRQISAVAAMIMIGFTSAHVMNMGWSGIVPLAKSVVSAPADVARASGPFETGGFPIQTANSNASPDFPIGFASSQVPTVSPPSSRLAALWRRLNGEPVAPQNVSQNAVAGDSMTVGNTLNFNAEPSPEGAGTDVATDDAAPRHFGNYQVELRDQSGRVVAVQHFDSLEEARDFVEALQRFDSRARAVPSTPQAQDQPASAPGNTNAILVHDQF
jgi:hypothetical protein